MLSELLEQLFRWNRAANSRTDAKQRLKLVIAQDRTGIDPDDLEAMRQEILDVVARYVEIDPQESEVSLESDNRVTALIANLPIKRVKVEKGLKPAELAKPEEPIESGESVNSAETSEPAEEA
ncbi:cell division topological specificity factor MinE [Oscillatoria sp. FACHB-1406]|uniref:cell division topological specificity factor MinE n=1 Tax=Oscillatoria sp. FACHB-1406 TaxID=2692846 RepID=UPI001685A22C|nr:cell division topological specificity factor MinE [Oscillatoria sp. FACHB-1406]MBD2577715.1 cell division topological specificity factor MinE [Oscillatoria sp. FACHB-1406]